MELQHRISQLQKELAAVDDESVIAAIETILELYQKANLGSRGIIGYSANGQSLSKSDLVEAVREASERVKSGKFITQKQLEQELENW